MRSWTADSEQSVATEPRREELPYPNLMKGVTLMTRTLTEQRSRWLTVDEVCTELRIARSTWEKWRQKDAGPKVVKLPNGQLRIRSEWLDTWIDEQPPMSI